MSADVVVDATPEEDQACAALPRQASAERLRDVPENQESIEDQMNVKLNLTDESEYLSIQSHANFDYDEFTPHDHLFPAKLRKKLNIAIIHDDEDKEEAHKMKVFIENNVHLVFGRIFFKPRVELLEYVSSDIRVDALDHALAVADYLFVYVTYNFFDRGWNQFQAISSVKAILTRPKDTQCSLVCVHTDKSLSNSLPAKLIGAKELHYYQGKEEQFKEDVGQYFSKISDRLLQERHALYLLRKKYVDDNPYMLKMMNPDTSRSHQNETVTETSKSSHDQSLSVPKDRTKRPGKQSSPVEERDSGASGNGAKQQINPQPHYR